MNNKNSREALQKMSCKAIVNKSAECDDDNMSISSELLTKQTSGDEHPVETIAAIATARGCGGIGIIRVSGPYAFEIASKIVKIDLKPRFAHFTSFYDDSGDVIDHGIVISFPGPNSYTGEDVVEFQGHGGSIVLDCLLKSVVHLGARIARPGEFTERAFLNNRIDLAQAEAVADVINATSEQALKSAMSSLQGDFSTAINDLIKKLIALRVYVEAAIDFPEEEVDFLSEGQVGLQLQGLLDQLVIIQRKASTGRLLAEGINLVLAGEPNAGKSSILNQLSGQDSAIVTDIAGTTRDVIRESIQINGVPFHLIDTAGLRHTDDIVEKEGIRRTVNALDSAERVLLVVDSNKVDIENFDIKAILPEGVDSTIFENLPLTVVFNKIDLTKTSPLISKIDKDNYLINLSAKTGEGIDILRNHLFEVTGGNSNTEGSFTARRRHLDALEQAHLAIINAQTQLNKFNAGEFVAEELTIAQEALSTITGEFSRDDLLGEIFSSFCIGK